MQIPKAKATATAASDGEARAVAAASRARQAATVAAAAPSRPTNWIDAITSQVGLAPLTDLPPMARPSTRPSALDDASCSRPYELAAVSEARPPASALGGKISRPAGAVTVNYRWSLGRVQRFFRWLNESAYLVSVPFLMLLILGVMIHSRSMALLGATVVVLLNVWRLVTGIMNLVVIPFRDSPIQGLLFLFPPYTLYYLYAHWNRVSKPARRVMEPILTVLAVVLAFAFVPWLASGEGASSPAAGPGAGAVSRIGAGAANLKSGMREKIERVNESRNRQP
jgi:hypothetical protein